MTLLYYRCMAAGKERVAPQSADNFNGDDKESVITPNLKMAM